MSEELINQEIADNFELAEKIRKQAEKIVDNRGGYISDPGTYERKVQTLLLAYICAKQTKHHLVEESLLLQAKK